MGFRMVSKLMTLNDLEQRNGIIQFTLPSSAALWGKYAQVVEDRPLLSVGTKM